MAEFIIGGVACRSRRMSAVEQWSLLRHLTPILPALTRLDFGVRSAGGAAPNIMALLTPLIAASDDDLGAVFDTCVAVCERHAEVGWEKMPSDLALSDLVALVMIVVSENFGLLFAMDRARFQPAPHDGAAYEPVKMPNDEDWIYRPFMRGKCRFAELNDGTLQIHDVAKMNDLLDVADENESRARRAAEKP